MPNEFDLGGLPPSANANAYQFTSVRSTLSTAFDSWLRQPNAATENLVDQALRSSGRGPLFGSSGRGQGSLMQPFQMPWQVRQFQQRQISNFSNQLNERMLMEGRMRRSIAARMSNFAGGSYSGSFAPFTGRAEWSTDPIRTSITSGSTSMSAAAFTRSLRNDPDEVRKLLKHIDLEISSLNRTEHRRLDFDVDRTNRSRGAPANFGAWWDTDPSFGRGRTSPHRVAPPHIGAALGAAMGGGGGGILGPAFTGGGGGRGGGGGSTNVGIFGAGRGSLWRNVIRAEEIVAALTWPLVLGKAEQAIVNVSKPFQDLRESLANQSRLVGGGGTAIEGGLLNAAGGARPQWLSRLGVTPTMFSDINGRMGGWRLGQNPFETVRRMREQRLSSAFSMAPEGTAESLGMMGMKLGITGTARPDTFGSSFATMLAQGQQHGADVRDLLASIKEATEAQVKTGVRLDLTGTAGWAEFLTRSMESSVPSARAGIMGGSLVAGFAAAGSRPFANALSGSVFSQVIANTNWNDPASARRLLGNNPDPTTLRLLQNPATRMNPLTIQRASQLIGGTRGGADAVAGVIRGMSPGGGDMSRAVAEAMMGTLIGGDWLKGQVALGATRPGVGRTNLIRNLMHGNVNPSTLPDVYGPQVEAQTAVMRGMREEFELFARHVHYANDAIDHFARGLGGQSSPFDILNPFKFPTIAPPSGGSGGVGGWIRGLFGGGGGVSRVVPGRGVVTPGGVGAPHAGLGPSGPGFSAAPGAEAEIIQRESHGNPNIGFGNVDLSNAPRDATGFPMWKGRMGPAGISHAAGLYQIQPGLWHKYAPKVGVTDFSAASQKKVYDAIVASEGYRPWAASGRTNFARPAKPNFGIGSAEAAPVLRLNRGFLVPPGTKFNSRGTPYSDSLMKMPPEEKARVEQSMEAIRAGQHTGKSWYQSYPTDHNMNFEWSGGKGAGSGSGGGGGHGGVSIREIVDMVSTLGHAAKETASHLHELGHGAKRANSGGHGGGPNKATPQPREQSFVAYP